MTISKLYSDDHSVVRNESTLIEKELPTFEKGFTDTIKSYVGDEKAQHNKIWLQRLTSNVCGVYCVYFIRELTERNLGSCLTMFSGNLAENDQYVLNYLKNI